MTKFGEFIDNICTDKGIIQAEIADVLGITPPLISNWKSGLQLPTDEQVRKILEFAKASDTEIAGVERAIAEARELKREKDKKRKRRRLKVKHLPDMTIMGEEDAIQAALGRIETKIDAQFQNIMESIHGLESRIAAIEGVRVAPALPQDIPVIRAKRPQTKLSRKLPGGVVRLGRIQRGGELRIGHTVSTEASFHPYESLSGMWMYLHQLVFDRLVNVAPEGFSKSLAYDWSALDEYSYVFRIREDVLFHNGKQLTAKDVVYSYQEWQSYRESNPIHSLEALENCNDHTLKIELKRSFPSQTPPPMPPIIPQGGFPDNRPIGTGPFQIGSIQEGLLKLTTNRGYFGDKPYLDKVVVRQYENSGKLGEALDERQIDFAFGLYHPTSDFIAIKDVEEGVYHLIFNMADEEISKNKNLRKAIYYGLDRIAIAKAAGIDNPEFATGPYSSTLEDYSDKDILYDLDKARRFLQDSTPLERPLLISSSAVKSEKRQNLVDAAVAELNELGIRAKRASETVPPSECQARVEIINCAPKWEREFWHSKGRTNLMKYKNREVDALLDRTIEPTEGDIPKLRELILEDCPALPLFFLSITITYDKRLKATEQRAISARFLGGIPYWYFEEALLEEEMRAIAS